MRDWRLFWVFLFTLPQISATSQELDRYDFQESKMGTSWSIVLYATSDVTAQNAAQKAWQEVDRLNDIFSDYEEESEITQLHHASGDSDFIPVSDDLWYLMRWSHKLSHLSEGAYDITISPLSKLWRRAIRQQELPNQKRIDQARQKVGYRSIQYDSLNRSVQLDRAGMKLDFGGIAKGYAVDKVAMILRGYGITRFLIDGGGDIYAGDPPPNLEHWKVHVQSIDQTLEICNQAIASSGMIYKYLVSQGQRYSHIVDPRSGIGVKDARAVNILANDCMIADALATALSVIGIEEGQELLGHYNASSLPFLRSN